MIIQMSFFPLKHYFFCHLILVFLLSAFSATGETLRAGFFISPPLYYLENNKVTGLYGDLLNLAAEKSGIDIEYVYDTFDRHIENLSLGAIDILPGVDPLQYKEIDTGETTLFEDWYVILTLENRDISGIQELSGKITGILYNAIRAHAEGRVSLPDIFSKNHLVLDSQAQVEKNLVSGTIYAAITRYSDSVHIIKANNGIKALPFLINPFQLNMGYSPGNNYRTDLENALSLVLSDKYFKKNIYDKHIKHTDNYLLAVLLAAILSAAVAVFIPALSYLFSLKKIPGMGRRISSQLELSSLMNSIHDELKKLLKYDMLGIGIVRGKETDINLYRFNDQGSYKLKTMGNDSPCNLFFYPLVNRKPILLKNVRKEITDYIEDNSFLEKIELECGSIIIIPVTFNMEDIGFIFLSSETPNFFRKKDLLLLKSFSGYASTAIRNAIMHLKIQNLIEEVDIDKKKILKAKKEVEYLAYHDPLTDLPNRLYLDEYLKQAIKKSARSGKILAVVFIDMDNFKQINDSYGHQTGDKVLVIAAQRFRNLLRESDTVIRFGGDEFIIILEDIISIDDLKSIANKIIQTCSSPVLIEKKNFTLSFSLGISIYPNDGDTADELIRKADIALYSVKNSAKGYWQLYSNDTVGTELKNM